MSEAETTTAAAPAAHAAADAAIESALSGANPIAALAALAAAEDGQPALPAEPVKATATAVAQPAATDAFDPREVMSRIARIENERDEAATARDTHAKDLAAARERAALADKYETLRSNPTALIQELGLTPEALQDYIVNGPKRSDPKLTAAEQKLAELDARQKSYEQREAQAAWNGKVAAFKANDLPAQVTAAEFPLLHAVHGDQPGALADEVWATMEGMFRQSGGKREPTAAEAAKAIETTLAKLHAAFQKTGGARAAVPAVGLTNGLGSARATSETDDAGDEDSRMTAALAQLRQGRK